MEILYRKYMQVLGTDWDSDRGLNRSYGWGWDLNWGWGRSYGWGWRPGWG
ncbi:hypothetical protein AGMMS49546_08700 [Spirochaetia bacterium]|nr:hypothetical protein AGMMS49546_08700 [Spirochaetia bacterium]